MIRARRKIVLPEPTMETLRVAILRGDLASAQIFLEEYNDDKDIQSLARNVLSISQNDVINPNEGEKTISPNAATVAGEILLLLAATIHGRKAAGSSSGSDVMPFEQYELLEEIVYVTDVLMDVNEKKMIERVTTEQQRQHQIATNARAKLEEEMRVAKATKAAAEAAAEAAAAAEASPALLMGLVVSPPSSPAATTTTTTGTNTNSSTCSPPSPLAAALPLPPSSPAIQSALAAAVREIQNLRRRTTASEERYVLQNTTCERKMARQAAEHAVTMASLKRKVQLAVVADRMESQRIARVESDAAVKLAVEKAVEKAVQAAESALTIAVKQTLHKSNEECEKRLRVSLGQAEVRHHRALQEMKTKFQQHLNSLRKEEEEVEVEVEEEEVEEVFGETEEQASVLQQREEAVNDDDEDEEEEEEEEEKKEEEEKVERQSRVGSEQTLEELAQEILEEDNEKVVSIEKKRMKEVGGGGKKKGFKLKKKKKRKKKEQERSASAPARFVISCDRDIKNRILLKRRATVGKAVKPRGSLLTTNQSLVARRLER